MLRRIRAFYNHSDKYEKDNRWIFTSMLVGAIGSLIAAFVLSVEAFELAKNPDAVLSCSVNLVINCATVAKTWQANLLGFPNSFFGLVAEPVVITVAIAGLAGVKFPRLFMFIAQVFYTLGVLFAFWLFYESFFVIQALCPWCLLVTATTLFVWFAISRYNIREGNLYLSENLSKTAQAWIKSDYDKLVLFGLVAVMVAAIIVKYGSSLL
ncbi:vitamin K epoxide reductase family protein [Microbacteriaceae bacterium]|nr:vitamin K epoxide reductase family protein [Candidatus Saccharibacteria bacterium]